MKTGGVKRGWSPVPEATDPKPWYRHFWPWVLIGLPLATVIAGVTTLFIAMDEPDSLVVGDYYKQGLAINRTLAREDAARALGLKGHLSIHRATGQVMLRLDAQDGLDSDALSLRLFHATREEHDRRVTLNTLGGQRYGGTLETPLNLGGWNLNLEPPDAAWRLSGRVHVTADSVAELKAELAP